MDWFLLAVIATTLFGFQSFLYNTSTRKGYDKFLVTLVFMITVEVLALISFLTGNITFSNFGMALLLGFMFSVAFLLTTLGFMKALEYLPANNVFPITSAGIILSVIYGLIFFNEVLKWMHYIGIIIILLAVILLHQDSRKHKNYHDQKKGFLICIGIMVTGTVMGVVNKYAAVYTDVNLFIVVNYLFSVIFSLVLFKKYGNRIKHGVKTKKIRPGIFLGISIGIVNFIAYLAYIWSLKGGNLSIIAPIGALTTIVVVILSWIVFKEEMDWKKFLLVILSIVGVILLRM